MIENEKQFVITKAQVKKFAEALEALAKRSGGEPELMELETKAIQSQLDELRQQLSRFEQLRSTDRSSCCEDVATPSRLR